MELDQLEQALKDLLRSQQPHLQVKVDTPEQFEVIGTKEIMQGRQKVEGATFASIVPKPKDVRLYFFPIYTDKEFFSPSPELQKKLKGKSCFHLKKIDETLFQEIQKMIEKGVEVYKEKEWI